MKFVKNLLFGLLIIMIPIAAAAISILGSNSSFKETFYTVDSPKISSDVRIVEISDLHQLSFGKNNQKLIERIDALNPDIIVLAGDIVNKNNPDIDFLCDVCSQLTGIAPVYYGLGNHENAVVYGQDLNRDWLDENVSLLGEKKWDYSPLIMDRTLLDRVEALGVNLLLEENRIIEINGNSIDIGATSCNASSFWGYSSGFVMNFNDDAENFRLLICHRPEALIVHKDEADFDIDLVLSGHTHGGIIRIPGKGGLIDTDGGFFPEYDGGMISIDNMTMVISKGFAGQGFIPRINNKPELVIVDLR